VLPPGEPRSISREVTFDHDLRDKQQLRQMALGLLQDVSRSLRAHRLTARTVVLKIRYQPFDTHSRQATLATPSDRDEDLSAALGVLLDSQLDAARPVRLIGAGVSNLETGATQLNLLERRGPERAGLDQQLDQLRERFGERAIVRGMAGQRPRQKDVRRDDLDSLSDRRR
jgi:DNA polymerase-4